MHEETTILDSSLTDYTNPASESSLPSLEIKQGMRLLGLYDVLTDVISGGMGSVFKVRHTEWDVNLAIKRPHAQLFINEAQKETFIRECESWIDLGLHPHIVSCYYVRMLGGVPSIFSEWMDGGSLKSWIEDTGSPFYLYTGDKKDTLIRILDIAIQYARGLYYAHESGLIHQDVKPDNLLMTTGGVAKVADFGISRARAVLTVPMQQDDSSTCTMLSEGGGSYTPAYCSIEQLNGDVITRRTDIWSFAVTLLEMLVGERLWPNGVVAGAGCGEYLEEATIPAPSTLRNLLLKCFEEDPEDRPHDFSEVEAALLYIYREVAGVKYPREAPKAASMTADSLNNHALSYLDINRPDLAEQNFKSALDIEKNNVDALFNQTMYKWRSEKTKDDDAALSMKYMYDNNPEDKKAAWLYANFCLERCDFQKAEALLSSIKDAPAFKDAGKLHTYAASRAAYGGVFAEIPRAGKIAVTSDGNYVVSLSDKGLQRFDAKTGELLLSHEWDFITEGERFIAILAISPDASRAVLAAIDIGYADFTRLLAVSTEDGRTLKTWPFQTYHLNYQCEFSSDGRSFTYFDYPGANKLETVNCRHINFFDIVGGAHTHTTPDLASVFSTTPFYNCLSPDGQTLCLADVENDSLLLALFDFQTGALKASAKCETPEKSLLSSVEYNWRGDKIIMKTNKNAGYIYSVQTGALEELEYETLRALEREMGGIISSDGTYVLKKRTMTGDQYFALYEKDTVKRVFEYSFDDAYLEGFCFDLCARRALLTLSDKSLNKSLVHSFPFPDKTTFEGGLYSLSKVQSIDDNAAAADEFARIREGVRKLLAANRIGEALALVNSALALPGYKNSPERIELNNEVGKYCRIKGVRAITWTNINKKYAENWQDKGNYRPGDELLFSPDGKTLFSKGGLYDFNTGKCLVEPVVHYRPPIFSPDSKLLFLGGKLYSTLEPGKAVDVEGFEDLHRHFHCCFSPDSGTLYISCADSSPKKINFVIKIVDVHTGKEVHSFPSPDYTGELSISQSGRYMIFLASSCIFVLDLMDSGKVVFTKKQDNDYAFQGPKKNFEAFFGPKETMLLTRDNSIVRTYDILTGEEIYTIADFDDFWGMDKPNWVHNMCISKDNTAIFAVIGMTNKSGTRERGIVLIDALTGKKLKVFAMGSYENSFLEVCAITPDGQYGLAFDKDWNFSCYDLRTGSLLSVLPTNISEPILHPGGTSILAVGSEGRILLLFDYEYEYAGQ